MEVNGALCHRALEEYSSLLELERMAHVVPSGYWKCIVVYYTVTILNLIYIIRLELQALVESVQSKHYTCY